MTIQPAYDRAAAAPEAIPTAEPFLAASQAVLLGDESVCRPGWVEWRGPRITASGHGPAPRQPDWTADHCLAPGFVDTHCHGGGGASYTAADPAQAAVALGAHRRRGTTTQIASLVSASLPDLMDQIAALRPLVAAGELAGLHLEGPWLAPSRKGAHDPALLACPTPEAVTAVLSQADVVRMVTVAPELPGALTAISRLAAQGVVAAVGHTEADWAVANQAVAAGARGATHLFNAMPPLLHRAPGPVLALLASPSVSCEIIFDTHHIQPALASAVLRLLGPRGVLVTDAMAAAGLGDGSYSLGGLPVVVEAGVARLAGQTTIAGSTITLADAVFNAVAAGLPLPCALAAASRNGADYLSLPDVGRLRPGAWADLVEVTADGTVTRAVRRGAWVHG
ncbi:MAG: amidohydrolase family protein [Propionibacteriaceae bacterium]|nr:amidohydrolase family protein [Propionibacteriaceae bacterium]